MKSSVENVIYALLLTFVGAQAADIRYPVSDIPDGLKENVNSIVRENRVVYTILSTSKANLKTVFVVTILNDKGASQARLSLGYDRLTRISSLAAAVYDAEGKVIRRLKMSDIVDVAAFDGFSLYSDDRLKSVDLRQSTYPYTVEFSYEVDYKYLYSIPGLSIANERSAIQHASYQLVYPPDIAPRFRVLNWTAEPTKERHSEKEESLTWTFTNVRPISFEPHGPHHYELIPRIIVAPSLFEYDGYGGDMSTWKEFGKWSALLNKGRDALPEATKQKIRELTRDLKTTEEKAKAVYMYLQSRSRYVSIQLGIGGLQPFPASVVDEVGYGDCKALSNYTVAMLKEAGVRGYYTIIRAGEDEQAVITDFPSHQSNHVIVAVPDGRDTLWLECTSQTKAFGYMGRFTGDRMALMITEEGGALVKTPSYTAEQNTQYRTAEVTIDAFGNAKAKVRTSYGGTQTENLGLDGILDSKADEQRKWILENTDIPNFSVTAFSMSGVKSKNPFTEVRLSLDLSRYASVSGKRLFLIPNLMNRSTYVPEKFPDRKTEVVRYTAYIDSDTINIFLPEALYPEFVPQPVKFASRFGEYEASFTFEEGKVVYIRRMKMRKGRFSKESYNELIEFYKNVNKYDHLKLVLVNKT